MPLPAKSPELNPVENIWQFIRDNWLSAWNKLADQRWTIMSIGLRDWAHRF
jgi:hypothetical protein